MQRGAAGVLARGLAIGVLAVWVSACVTDGQRTGTVQTGQRPSVAFESIDGAPPAVFQKLVQKLNDEANARHVPVVTREGYAPYRIRGYVAASVVKKQTVVSWVWDVYDGETRRAARLTGEEKAGPAGSDAWNAANNDAVLARVARSGMEQLAAFLGGPAAPAAAPAPTPAGPAEDRQLTVAAADDVRPETLGIFRLSAASQGQDVAATGAIPAESRAPLPPRRPSGAPQQVAAARAF
ncbi:MAG: hypothetical protein RO009_12500 [Pseudorhodoplanes sp.]|jgi:hypothetical protein|nr:hypothetical protein [Pseudorhodoplanes sp.]